MKKNFTKILLALVAIFVVGTLAIAGIALSEKNPKQTQNVTPQDYLKEQAQMMTDSGSMMQNMSNMMLSDGKMMQQKGSQYKDSEMMQKGKEMTSNAQKMQEQSKSLMNSGQDFTSKIK